jgi:hypothetical protein
MMYLKRENGGLSYEFESGLVTLQSLKPPAARSRATIFSFTTFAGTAPRQITYPSHTHTVTLCFCGSTNTLYVKYTITKQVAFKD